MLWLVITAFVVGLLTGLLVLGLWRRIYHVTSEQEEAA